MRKYARETSLNEKFKGTWVAEGLADDATKGSVAQNHKIKDLIEELVAADGRADEYLLDVKKSENLNLIFKDPPIEFGKYYTKFCTRNANGYRDYKSIGIKEMVRSEEKRFDKKQSIQIQAKR